jgi:5-hydroxyisourate hydrolase-like protein (transthyretin family)
MSAATVGARENAGPVTSSADDKRESQESSSAASVSTAISATASPRQQVAGSDVTITGQLSASGAPIAGAPVRLYIEGADLWSKISETITNEAGNYAFRVQQPTAGWSSFKVVFPGSANHKPSMSDELPITYVAIPTTVTAAAIPRQQFIGGNVAIKGQLSASGAPLGDVHIILYNADDVIERVPVATAKTDASGAYQFTLTERAPGQHAYVVHVPGTGTHASAESAPVSVAYVTVPTAITAVVNPREQCVGHDVTITGQLTTGGTSLADSSVMLYNADDVARWVPVAETTTDDAGYYQFRVKDTTPGRHSFVVHAPARGTHAAAQSAEIAFAYLAIPTAITASAVAVQPGHSITGQLTAGGTPLADSSVTLYNADDVAQNVPVAETKTDASGYYEFSSLTQNAATGHVFRVHYAGDAAHTSAHSTDVLVHYGTPRAETTATPPAEAPPAEAPPAEAPVAAPRKLRRLGRREVVLLVVAAVIVVVAIFLIRL